ncbi:hypothetical protein HYW44_01985 [Candidatus Daviesbacteria bacterium]|nr:hypothetical protein [Candidatus Daviesbacteria bacterium]
MPHLSGVFEQFPNLDKVSSLNLSAWLHIQVDKHNLANILGNRIIYPQTVALTKSDLEIDLAILREALKQRPALVYEPQTNKIYIPELFLQRFPPLTRLAGVIIEAINPKGVIQIYLKDKTQVKLLGSLISPPNVSKLVKDKGKIKIVVMGVEGTLSPNTLSISRIVAPQIKMKIENTSYSVPGGELGVVIDLRVKS